MHKSILIFLKLTNFIIYLSVKILNDTIKFLIKMYNNVNMNIENGNNTPCNESSAFQKIKS